MTEFDGTTAPAWISILDRNATPDDPIWLGPGNPVGGLYPSPPAISIPHGHQIEADLAVLSSPTNFPGETTFTATTTANSNQLTSCSTTSGLAVGQPLSCNLSNGLQNGVVIQAISGTTVTMTGNAFVNGTGVQFVATDWYPLGTVAVTVSPTTGVTIADFNFDGTSNAGNIGNGTAIANYSGQGVGELVITFATAGIFTVSGTFTSSDPLYADAILPSLTVIAT